MDFLLYKGIWNKHNLLLFPSIWQKNYILKPNTICPEQIYASVNIIITSSRNGLSSGFVLFYLCLFVFSSLSVLVHRLRDPEYSGAPRPISMLLILASPSKAIAFTMEYTGPYGMVSTNSPGSTLVNSIKWKYVFMFTQSNSARKALIWSTGRKLFPPCIRILLGVVLLFLTRMIVTTWEECVNGHIDGLKQECRSIIVNALELLQSCAKSSIFKLQ